MHSHLAGTRPMNHSRRFRLLRMRMHEQGVEALLITHLADVRYLCGFTGSNAALGITDGYSVLFTDGRYTAQAGQQTKAAKVVIAKKSALAESIAFLAASGAERCFFDSAHTTVAQLEAMRQVIGKTQRRSFFKPLAKALVAEIRMVKDARELARMEAAASLGCRLFEDLISRIKNGIKAGITETALAAELEYAARLGGAEGMSFETIVASGARSALPHGVASNAPLPPKGFMVLDFGVILNGYCSDMTRTVFLGKATIEERFAFDSVLAAQAAAIDRVRAGATCGEVDEAARTILRKARLEKYFTHSTGHGVGLEIHEQPRIAADQVELLKTGMVITIEPGVYRTGKFGIRIEDTVVVTEDGCRILTPAPKTWIQL